MKQRKSILLLFIFALLIPSHVFAAKTHKVKKSKTLTSGARKHKVAKAETSAVRSYKVKHGDTLTSISKKTGVSIAKLKQLNSFSKGKLKPGEVIALREIKKEREYRESADKQVQVAAVKPTFRYKELLNDKDDAKILAELKNQDTTFDTTASSESSLSDDSKDNVKLLQTKAFGLLGTRYVFGGTTRSGIDCSAFVQKVFGEMNVKLPRTAREQFLKGEPVDLGNLQKGDLIFFHTYAPFPSHVGIYLGNNKMIHASSRNHKVVISSMDTPYYLSHFIGAKRIARINPDALNVDELTSGVEEESANNAVESENDTLGLSMVDTK
ncbi:MAG: NlpC/P60 family protein [Desulfuromonadales bacterium]|nr:NlpC/P60 family protein [Desulfuromonadales bacterium]